MNSTGLGFFALAAAFFTNGVTLAATGDPQQWSAWYVITLFAVGGLAAAYGAFIQFIQKPHLVVEPICKPDWWAAGEPASWVYVRVKNRRCFGGVTAEHVHARVTFRNDAIGFEHVLENARWAHMGQTRAVEATMVADEISIPPNDSWRLVDVAFKYMGEDDWYGFDNENYGWHELKHHRLEGERVMVTLEVFASNSHKMLQFELVKKGRNDSLECVKR